MNQEYKFIFTEDFSEGYKYSEFTDSELRFFRDKELIKEKTKERFTVLFVGEIITPDGKYFSVPKNFPPVLENIALFTKVLDRYKKVKDNTGKVLLQNNSFTVSQSGDYKSENFYYYQLKKFFLDYVTYEFIYPHKRKKIHSSTPVSGGKIDVLETVRKRKQYGYGITYKVKDIKNSNKWNLDDIYWTVIHSLTEKYGSEVEMDQVMRMYNILKDQGYDLKIVDISNTKKMITDIASCDVGIVHLPIRNTLISYFENHNISESYTIKVFYTRDFAYVWEWLVRDSLKHNLEFKNSLKSKFEVKQNSKKYFKTHAEMDEWRKKYSSVVRILSEIPDEKGGYIKFEKNVTSIPDLFSEYNGIRFIGDAKYYKDPHAARFEKEMREYNIKSDNLYPMVILIPSDTTNFEEGRSEDDLELVILNISVQTAIDSAVNNNDKLITQVHDILRKFSRRLVS